MELSKLSGYKLYMIRNSDNAKEVDAELDRRNGKVAKKSTRKSSKIQGGMIDSHYENNRWFIEDDGTIKRVSA